MIDRKTRISISEEVATAIIKEYNKGGKPRKMAIKYNVSESTIFRLVKESKGEKYKVKNYNNKTTKEHPMCKIANDEIRKFMNEVRSGKNIIKEI